MNIKNLALFLIVALGYEILLKITYLFIPSLSNLIAVNWITLILSYAVSLITILFLLSFYRQERSNRNVANSIKLLVLFFLIRFFLRLPSLSVIMDYQTIFLIKQILMVIQAILLFILILFYEYDIPSRQRSFKKAAILLILMFGIGIVKSICSLVFYLSYIYFGITVDTSFLSLHLMLFLFVANHLIIIYFLYQYRKFR